MDPNTDPYGTPILSGCICLIVRKMCERNTLQTSSKDGTAIGDVTVEFLYVDLLHVHGSVCMDRVTPKHKAGFLRVLTSFFVFVFHKVTFNRNSYNGEDCTVYLDINLL